jgi:hypothetical protein
VRAGVGFPRRTTAIAFSEITVADLGSMDARPGAQPRFFAPSQGGRHSRSMSGRFMNHEGRHPDPVRHHAADLPDGSRNRSRTFWIVQLAAVGGLACAAPAPSGSVRKSDGSAPLSLASPDARTSARWSLHPDAATGSPPAPSYAPVADGRPDRSTPLPGERPAFRDCVTDALEMQQKTRQIILPGGVLQQPRSSTTCSMEADCVHEHGRETPGDGMATINCKDKTCTCTLVPLAPRSRPIKFRIEADAPCASAERTKALLTGRCLREMQRVPKEPEATSLRH